MNIKYILFHFLILIFFSCSDQDVELEEEYIPVPFSLKIPEIFQQKLLDPLIPNNNPLTEEGVALGKKLFFDKKLSGNNTHGCCFQKVFYQKIIFSLKQHLLQSKDCCLGLMDLTVFVEKFQEF